jgi:lysophospholipase L1-like esterase
MAETYTPSQPGTYTVETTAVPAVGPPVTASATFRVIAEGGGIDNDPGSPPRVITARTVPKAGAEGVPVTVFPQIAFTEPVRQVPGNVSMLEPDGTAVPLKLSGVTTQGVVIENVTDTDVVTSLTLQPLAGLKYNTTYRLVLTAGIEDLDKDASGNPAPKALVPYETSFTTFRPVALGGSEDQTGSAGIVVLGERTYLTRTNNFVSGNLLAFDITDPVSPQPVGEPPFFAPRPYDIAGEQSEDGTRLIAVATGATNTSKPASVLFFDATTDEIKWVGAATVANSAQEGFISRLALKGDFAYTATVRQGIQIVQVTRNLEGLDPVALQNARAAINTDGSGFGQDAVVQTIPIPKKPNGSDYYLSDLKVGDIRGEPLVVASGEPGIVIANPQTGTILYPLTFPTALKTADGSFTLGWGQALALGRLSDRDVAVALTRSHLVTIDLNDPTAPRMMGYIDLRDQLDDLSPVDVILKGETALVSAQNSAAGQGRVLLISLTAPDRPAVVGTLSGHGGRLALGTGGLSNILFSTGYSPFGGANLLGGVRAASFGAVVLLLDKDKKPLPRIRLPKHYQTFVDAVLPGADDTVDVEVSIVEKDGSVRRQTGEIPTQTTLTLQRDPVSGRYIALLKIADKDCAIELDHNEIDEQVIKTPCTADLESGPWTRLRIKVPEMYGGLERVVDIHAFRFVAIGDSLTQGVQHAIVVHQHQRYSFPAQMANRINKLLKDKYGQQMRFIQAMIAEPGIGDSGKLGKPFGEGSGRKDELGFPVPGRLNAGVQPVNNLGISGARAYHLYTSKEGNWPPYCPANPERVEDSPPFCDLPPDNLSTLKNQETPIWNYEAPKSVWHYSLGGRARTPVEQAAELDPSLLLVQIGNNDVMNAAVDADLRKLTPPDTFREQYDHLLDEIERLTQGRADIVVATVPDVNSIPNLRIVGEQVGSLPFTVDVPLFDQRKLTQGMEQSRVDPLDEDGDCHGSMLENGTCEKGSAKAPLAKIFATQGFVDQIKAGVALRRGGTTFRLKAANVLGPDEQAEIEQAADSLNSHVLKRAQERGFAVMDVRRMFNDRLAPETIASPKKLTGLFTGTPWRAAGPNEEWVQGIGNSLFGWDGVHANSAGYALAANLALQAINGKVKDRPFGGLEAGTQLETIPSGSKDERDSITWLLFKQYLDLSRTRSAKGHLSTVE